MKENLYPWLRQITLKQMRGFTAAVNSGSASAAARELHLTPPAISLQLRDLENAIGLPLLERSESGLMTTLAGQELFELSSSIQNSLTRFGEVIDDLKGVDHGIVAVGVVSTARYFAPTVLAEFMKVYPEVKIQLLVGNRETTMAKLESMELDFAITGLPPDHFGVEKEFISKHPQIIIALSASIRKSSLPHRIIDWRKSRKFHCLNWNLKPSSCVKRDPARARFPTSSSRATKTCPGPLSNLVVTKLLNRPSWWAWELRLSRPTRSPPS